MLLLEGFRAMYPVQRSELSWFEAAVFPIVAAGVLSGINGALAQHETAFDIQDGARAYQDVCANCHGPDGDLIPGMDFSRGIYRAPLSDEEIVRIILQGIPDTPMPPTPGVSEAQAQRIVAYLRSMGEDLTQAAAGDPERGRAIFEGKGGCLDCHRVGRVGSRLGPDLTRIGLVRRTAELEQSLLDPQAVVQPENRSYSVTVASGETITGRLLNHDTFTVQIIDTDERLRSFQKAQLLEHGFIDSPMPSFRNELDAQEVADVVSYLASLLGEDTP